MLTGAAFAPRLRAQEPAQGAANIEMPWAAASSRGTTSPA